MIDHFKESSRYCFDMSRIIHVFFLFAMWLFQSCGHASEKKDTPFAASIDGKPILLDALDSTIHKQLYERLFDIYYNRKIALDELIGKEVLTITANKAGISVDSLIGDHQRFSELELQQFIQENNLDQGIPNPHQYGTVLSVYSNEGRDVIVTELRRRKLQNYVEELMKQHDLKIFLYPPLPPRKKMEGIKKHPMNPPLRSGPEVTWISDFGCEKCHDAYPLIANIVKKYGDRVTFSYAHFSNEPNVAILAAQCASEQLDFYLVLDPFEASIVRTEKEALSRAREMKLDTVAFKNCLRNKAVVDDLRDNFQRLLQQEISLTPTLLIDDRIYYGQFDLKNIAAYLDMVLEKK